MSTERQQYSTQNPLDRLREFAASRGLALLRIDGSAFDLNEPEMVSEVVPGVGKPRATRLRVALLEHVILVEEVFHAGAQGDVMRQPHGQL